MKNEDKLEIILKSGRKISVSKDSVQFYEDNNFEYDSSKSIAESVKYPPLRWINNPHMVNYYLGKKNVGPLIISLNSVLSRKQRTEYIPRESIESIIDMEYKKKN